jgi:vancomycin permeability regulator SanA
VLGAGVRPDGSLSPFLSDRVDAAVELHRLGRVRHLLMTGDNGRRDYDEVSAMRRAAVARGVPAGDVTLDYAGFSTYDSCYRAREVFGVRSAVVVTQAYHLRRAVYTCRSLGLDAVGLGLPDWEVGRYRGSMPRYQAREVLATYAALWRLHVTRPAPRYLGPAEPILAKSPTVSASPRSPGSTPAARSTSSARAAEPAQPARAARSVLRR